MTADQSAELSAEELAHIDPAEAAIALDLLLTEAALGVGYHFRPRTATVRMGVKLATKPQAVAKRTAELAAELAAELTKVALGKSDTAPPRGDRRFASEAWQENSVLKRVLQSYLAAGKTASDLLEDAELSYDDHERAEFLIRIVNDALAPSNPPLNPDAIAATKKTKGKNLAKGAMSFAKNMAHAPRTPSMIEDDAFEVGKNLAITPGSVVARTEMLELIQYTPSTKTVYRRPLLFIPPMINKFYAVDLAPGRSLVEYLVAQGHQVFVISWRNPTADNRDWGFDSYGAAIIDAMATTRNIAQSKKLNLFATCSGGIVTTMTLAHLKAQGELEQVSSLALAVAVLNQDHAGLASAALNESIAKAAIAISASRGYLDGRNLAEAFAWLRPNDLIWSYWVNNYLLGRTPPKFDVLYWNADTTRMPGSPTISVHGPLPTEPLNSSVATSSSFSVVAATSPRSSILPGTRRPSSELLIRIPRLPKSGSNLPPRNLVVGGLTSAPGLASAAAAKSRLQLSSAARLSLRSILPLGHTSTRTSAARASLHPRPPLAPWMATANAPP